VTGKSALGQCVACVVFLGEGQFDQLALAQVMAVNQVVQCLAFRRRRGDDMVEGFKCRGQAGERRIVSGDAGGL